jgi:hypothetical protein
METQHINRPWQKKYKQGNRYNPDPHYQSTSWKNTRKAFRATYTEYEGIKVPNIFCIDCYKEQKRFVEGSNLDHIVRRKDGGSDDHSNLQTLCNPHHAKKSAKEGNQLRKV